ncbi:hypothetical protein YC2023_099089 [Brassica napus]
MMFDGFCSLSQSIVVLGFVHVWVREFLLHKAYVSLCLIVNPSPFLFSRSLFSDDANHGLEDSLTRALSLSSSISGSLHLSCLSLCLESSGMMFDGFCSLSQSIVVLGFVHVWVLEFPLHKAYAFALSISLVSALSLESSGMMFDGSQARKLTLSMAIDTWKPEETRYFFELYAEERRKGNKAGISMNKVGKANIMEAFEQRFKKNLPDWKPYKSKYDTSRKKYIKIKTLTQNGTGLGFDDMGRIDMSDDWWSEREMPAAETQALETETQPQAPRQTQPSTQNHFGSSRAKRRRKEKDMVVEACVKRTEALEVKNKIAELMLERQEAFSIENVLEILYALPEVREWSPLYEAAMEILIDNEGNRRAFVTMKTDEAKIRFLELRTKIKRDDD